MKNWKTTTLGILTILGTLVNAAIQYLHGQHVDVSVTFAGITAGWGLLHASDASAVAKAK